MNPLHREAWRALPLDDLFDLTLDAPTLAYDSISDFASATRAWNRMLRLRQSHAYLQATKKFKAADYVGDLIRKRHLERVSLAIGVKLPGHPHVIHEFADA